MDAFIESLKHGSPFVDMQDSNEFSTVSPVSNVDWQLLDPSWKALVAVKDDLLIEELCNNLEEKLKMHQVLDWEKFENCTHEMEDWTSSQRPNEAEGKLLKNSVLEVSDQLLLIQRLFIFPILVTQHLLVSMD